jgi:hypothetical protein
VRLAPQKDWAANTPEEGLYSCYIQLTHFSLMKRVFIT